MKKIISYSLLFLVVLLLTGCGKLSSYQEIGYKKVLEKIEKKESFILYIGSSECSACEEFSPILKSVIRNYQVKVYYLNVHKLSDKEVNKFETIINFGGSTPKVYFIKDGEYSQYNAIKGTQSYDYIVSKMKKNGYIEE